MTNGYSTDKYIIFEAVIDFSHEEDNTEDKLARLLDDFMDNAIEFVESKNAYLAAVSEITSDAEKYGEENDETWGDEFSHAGRLISDPDEYDDDEEEEEVLILWQPEE